MSDQQFKADAGKARPDLLSLGMQRALRIVQATMEYGAIKYEAHSWRNVPNAQERYFAAAERHHQERLLLGQGQFLPILEGCDPESKLPHIAHEIFNLLALIELELDENPDLLDKLIQFAPPPTSHKEQS